MRTRAVWTILLLEATPASDRARRALAPCRRAAGARLPRAPAHCSDTFRDASPPMRARGIWVLGTSRDDANIEPPKPRAAWEASFRRVPAQLGLRSRRTNHLWPAATLPRLPSARGWGRSLDKGTAPFPSAHAAASLCPETTLREHREYHPEASHRSSGIWQAVCADVFRVGNQGRLFRGRGKAPGRRWLAKSVRRHDLPDHPFASPATVARPHRAPAPIAGSHCGAARPWARLGLTVAPPPDNGGLTATRALLARGALAHTDAATQRSSPRP